jgi:DNA-binding GntR family transcriptional regulator
MTMVQKTTIKEQAYQIIKKKILTQEYQLGDRINIGQLARELGISNSPLREALNLLEKEGLVVTTPNSVIKVITLSRQDFYELAQMIFFWMVGAYRYVVEVGRIAELSQEMTAVLEKQKQYQRERNVYEFTYQADMFDRCMLVATGNQRLIAQFDAVFPLFFLSSLYDYAERDHDWQIGVSQHERILSAMQAGRHDEVITTLEEHYYKPVWDLRIQDR